MSTADWYRSKVGRKPSYEPPRFVLGADGRAQPVHARQQPEPEQYPQPWRQPVGPGEPPIGQSRLSDSLGFWRGSRGAQDTGHCPNCRSGNYMAEVVAQLAEGQGGESGRRSAGFCMDCGYRPGRGAPSLQLPAGIRMGTDSLGDVPIEQARSAATPEALRWTGKFGIVQRITAG